MQKFYFLLSIDTEEEWDWEGPFPEKKISVKNAKEIPAFQNFLNQHGIKASYFIDYAIAEIPESQQILQQVFQDNSDAEVCAHLHPWVNPPIVPVTTEAMSHIVNLPIDQVESQLVNLTELLEQVFGRRPTSFRSGRWGINGEILRCLAKHGYRVDSSIYPYYETEHFSCRKNNAALYWPDYADPENPGSQRDILEIPVTAGFNRKNFAMLSRLHYQLEKPPWHYFRAIGILWQTNLLRKIYLSPELSSERDLIALCQNMLTNGSRTIHMYLHSSSLLPGAGSYVNTQKDKIELLQKIEAVIKYLKAHAEVEFITVGGLGEIHRKSFHKHPP
jgi:hypothetical protein